MDITTKKQWDALEKPLIEIDDELLRIANKKNLTIDKNHQNWPSRSLSWRTGDGLDRKLEVSMDENGKFFQIYGYVWCDDANGQRFIKILNLKKGIKPPLIKVINDIVLQNIDLINKIKKEELKEAVLPKEESPKSRFISMEIIVVFIIFFIAFNLTSDKTILGIVAFVAFCYLYIVEYKKSKKKQLREGAKKIKDIIDASYAEKHEIEEIKAVDYKDFDLDFYNQKQKEFELNGFTYIVDYKDKTIIKANPNSRHFIRVMLNKYYSIEVAIFDIKMKGFFRILQFLRILPQDLKTIDLETEFEDGSFITTTTTKMDLMDDSPKVFKEIVDKNMATGEMIEKHFKRILEHEKKFNTKHILIRNKEEMFQSQARLQKLRSEYRKQLGGVITKEEMDRISKGSKIGKEVRDEIENLYGNREGKQIIKITSRLVDELKEKNVNIDSDKLPENLRDLLPFAKEWSIGDDEERKYFLETASEEKKKEFLDKVWPKMGEIEEWCARLRDKMPVSYEAILYDMLAETAAEVYYSKKQANKNKQKIG